MKASKLRSTASVGVLLLGLVASGLVASSAGATGTKAPKAKPLNLSGVTLSLGDISEQLQLPLSEAGLITPNGDGTYSVKGYAFKLKFTQFIAGPEAFAGIVGGSIDLAVSADTPAIFAEEQGVKFKTVGVRLPNLPGADFSIVLAKGSTITSLAQLKGQTIAAQTGTINEYFAFAALASAGLPTADVTLDNLTPALSEASLSNGSIAAAVLPEPYVSLEKLQGYQVLTNGTGFINGYGFLDASQAALNSKAKSAAIGDFLKLLNSASVWTSANQTQWVGDIAATYSLPVSLAGPLATDSTASFVPINATVINATQSEANVFYNQSELQTPVKAKNIFDNRYNSIVATFK
jgi:sulfonate transport system substrate-binding protein